ncbi:hypothetical protein EYZ11_012369 [Aspergillus tanneri]|uniref:Extracellular membrane protein CFEM domain-containing protein n=1 Tax=Aspergillus tanneri TaxID=1220188 RepID=A0A4S3J2I9_9EURO|nr:hypothetical protein EYZ11_012369 [Aspergillus tanneri]
MKLVHVSFALAAFLGTVVAQGMDGLPDCACSDDDQQAALKFAKQICTGVGVKDLPDSASCTSGDSTATEKSASATETSTGSASSSTASAKTNDASTTSASDTSKATSGASSKADSSTGSSTSPSESPTASTGSAAVVHGKDTSLIAAVSAALFALLA